MLTNEQLDHLIVHGRCGDEPDFRRVVASHRDALDVVDGILRALGRNAANVTDPISVAEIVYRELVDLRKRVYGMKRRIHLYEGHNQYFERCESAWCNPSPDNDPAMAYKNPDCDFADIALDKQIRNGCEPR